MDTILFIGAGNMGSAILEQAVSRQAFPASEIAVFDTDGTKSAALGRLGVRVLGSLDGVAGCGAVLLCVKPRDIPAAAAKAPGLLSKDGLLVSIAAGVSIGSIERASGGETAVCRVMPNINVLSGSGMSAVSFNGRATPHARDLVRRLFSASGDVLEIEESKLNAVTGLSGSGPAYAALFISALTDGGVKSGLTNAEAYRLALQTVGGTVDTLRKLGCLPEQVKNMVSSPGGTTIDAVHSLERNRFRAAVIEAVDTATRKAVLLGKAGEKK
jgi:pyrroline-5-carboxylate reductase